MKPHKEENEKYYEAFQNAALKIFGKLAENYGLQLEQKGADTFIIPLSSFNIKIHLAFGHLRQTNVLIIPKDTCWDTEYNELSKNGIGLNHFVRYQNHEFPKTYYILNNTDEVRIKLQTLCDLLQKYCDPFLRGDFSIWPEVVSYVDVNIKKLIEEYKHND